MSRALLLCAAGSAAGLAAALAVGRALAGEIPGVGFADPLTLVVVTAGVAAIALVASFLPARRAARLDPIVALRTE